MSKIRYLDAISGEYVCVETPDRMPWLAGALAVGYVVIWLSCLL